MYVLKQSVKEAHKKMIEHIDNVPSLISLKLINPVKQKAILFSQFAMTRVSVALLPPSFDLMVVTCVGVAHITHRLQRLHVDPPHHRHLSHDTLNQSSH